MIGPSTYCFNHLETDPSSQAPKRSRASTSGGGGRKRKKRNKANDDDDFLDLDSDEEMHDIEIDPSDILDDDDDPLGGDFGDLDNEDDLPLEDDEALPPLTPYPEEEEEGSEEIDFEVVEGDI